MALNGKSWDGSNQEQQQNSQNKAIEAGKAVIKQGKQAARQAKKEATKKAASVALKWFWGIICQAAAAIVACIGWPALIVIAIVLIVVVIVVIFSVPSAAAEIPTLSEAFYGVRVYYINQEKATNKLNANYNELAFEFLQTVGSLPEVESLNITFPETIVGADFTEYKTELTNELVNIVVESVLKSEGLLIVGLNPEETPNKVTAENLSVNLAQIEHFGFSKANLDAISTNLTHYFVEVVEADTENELITFSSTFEYDQAAFTALLTNIWQKETFNKYKVLSEKVFVKDVINGSNCNVDGIVKKVIYMPNQNASLGDRIFKAIIKDDSVYEVTYKIVSGEEETVLAKTNIDNSWSEYEESLGDYFYKGSLEIDGDSVTCEVFNNIDTNNTAFLSKDNFTPFDAACENLETTNICFSLVEDELNLGYYTINLEPSTSYTCIEFVDKTPNGAGTQFTFTELDMSASIE